VLEAMACGLPVVASDIGDIPLLVKDNVTGYLINKGDYKELSCKINLLLDDDTLRKKMSKNARTLIINNYSAEIMGKKTVEVYDRVLEERK
jgi:glycosyltransferase involved in cell wall biosynthesis